TAQATPQLLGSRNSLTPERGEVSESVRGLLPGELGPEVGCVRGLRCVRVAAARKPSCRGCASARRTVLTASMQVRHDRPTRKTGTHHGLDAALQGWGATAGGAPRGAVYSRQRLFRHSRGGAGVAADGTHYPGTYIAGCFNQLRTEVAGRAVESES